VPVTPAQSAIGEGIDRLISIEIGGRGAIGALYAAARAAADGPLCLGAATHLLERVPRGGTVLLATGLPTPPWFTGEQDGPVGAATLARSLVIGLGAHPVVVTDPVNAEICTAALRGAGLHTRALEDALRLPAAAAVVPFALEWEEAAAQAPRLLEQAKPSALVAIERPGANEQGHYHSAAGKRLTDHCAKIDVLFRLAREREILTIGIGDGGNEIGCGAVRDAVVRAIPHGGTCACPCGGTVVPAVGTDLLVAAAISNWGAYGIEAALAVLLGRDDVLHSRAVDARAQELCAAAGANNIDPGLLDVGADGIPERLHGHIVDLLGQMVESALDFGRLYREPRAPWR
jgi:hypothetical protein